MGSLPLLGTMEDAAVPPGFTRLTSFTLQKVQSDSPVESPLQPLKYACSTSDTLRKLLQDRPWVNYNKVYTISDSEDEEMPDQRVSQSLPSGVIRGCPDCEDCQKFVARWRPNESCRPILDEAPVFHPNEEEFGDSLKYIESIRAIAEPYGICRIVPPASWKPPPLLTEKRLWESSKFSTRVQQIDKLQNRKTVKLCHPRDILVRNKRTKTLSSQGNTDPLDTDATVQNQAERFGFHSGPDFTLQSFKKYADLFHREYFLSEADRRSIPSVDEIEGEYWRIVEKPTEIIEVLYGADLDTASFGSGFPRASTESRDSQYVQSGWNLNNIPNLPRSMLRFESSNISGVKIPWLYVGMCLSSFCWHVEDHHLYSLNYMHMGAPKVWYGVPEKDAQSFEAVMKKSLLNLFEEQPDLLHNLVTQFSPSVLKREGVSIFRCVQNEGEFVLTFPRSYHSGFNCGFNCAEAVNLAPIDWFPHGLVAVELYRQQRRVTTLSHDKLLISAAKEAVRVLWNIYVPRKYTPDDLVWKLVTGEHGILTKTFYVRKEAEQRRRKFLCSPSQCRKMDAGFDTAVRECVFCHYDLYLSAVVCSSCPGKYACLMHAKELCFCNWSSRRFLFRYNDDELDLLHDAIKDKLNSVLKWASTYLGVDMQKNFRVCKEVRSLVNKPNSPNNVSEEMRDTTSTDVITQHQYTKRSGQISDGDENSETRNEIPTRKGEGPSPSAVAQGSVEAVPTCTNRSANTTERDAAVTGTSRETWHGANLSGQMSGHSESTRIRATRTRNKSHEGPSSSAMAQNSNNMPEQLHYLPRFIKVGEEGMYTIEILEYGIIMPHKLWSTRQAIFPKGFRSRVHYWSTVEPTTWCDYICEILDAGLVGPLFMVLVEENPSEVFVHVSPKRCWDLVVEKVNAINKIFYRENKRRGTHSNPFDMQKPVSIDGLDMFGLSDSTVIQDLEALDSKRESEFCRLKDQSKEQGTASSVASEVEHPNFLIRRVAHNVPSANSTLVLQQLFRKINPEELRALETVFSGAAFSSNVRQEAALLLSEEIRTRQR